MAELLDDVVTSGTLRELVQPAALNEVVVEHRGRVHDHGDLLWGLVNLALWRGAFRC
jgi:hypothetical protein